MHGQGMVHGDLKGVGLLCSTPPSASVNSFVKANILIDESGRALLADFGLLAIISDATGPGSSSPLTHGGTCRWMSPELFYPEDFGLKDSRRTKYSDCYAMGMVIYEVLSGQVPFPRYEAPAVIAKVGRGERPERPEGAEGNWFTDTVWGILERCWAPSRDDRPIIEDVLRSLEEASRSWTPLSRPTVEDPPATDSPTWSLSDSSTGESAGKCEVSFICQAAPSLPPQTLLPKGDTDHNSHSPTSGESPALLHEAPDHREFGVCVKNPKGSDLKEFIRVLDRVSGRAFSRASGVNVMLD